MLIYLNYAICVIGALLCLYALISKKIDNNHIHVFFYFSFAGLAWCAWIFFAITHKQDVDVMEVFARFLMMLATILAVHAMRGCQAKVSKEQGQLLKRRSTDR